MPEGKQIQRMFTGIAGRYDLLNHLLSMGTDFYWWRRMARASGAEPGRLFLDVAAGTGDSTVAVARRRAEVISTDFTFAMLAQGPAKFRRKGLEGLIWASVGADAQALPFHSDTFDGVTICYGLRNIEDRSQACAEFLRVLKPGGRLTILEFSRPHSGWLRGLYGWYSRVVLPRLGAWVSGDSEAYAYLPDSIRSFPDQKSLARELERAGFEKVTWKNLTGGIAALHLGGKPLFLRSAFPRGPVMSKPDPSITANLLNSLLGKTETHQENAPKRPGKQSHTDAHPENPTPKPPKLKTAKNSASGQGRMRSSNRGK